ncbi:MAG: tetratricopeptide repeat protein [Pseudomonadota bacterium]
MTVRSMRLSDTLANALAHTIVCVCLVSVLVLTGPHAAAAQSLSRDEILRQAAEARAKGELRKAVRLLSQVLSEAGMANDRRAIILNDRAMVYARLQAYDKAFEDFNASAGLFPENPALYNNRGAVLTALGLHAEALKDLDRAVKLAPGYGTAYANRALAEIATGRLGSALLDFRQAVRLIDDKSQPLVRRARVFLEINRPNAALRDLNHALTYNARSAMAYRLRARARAALGDASAVLEDLSRAIAFEPKDVGAHMMRGEAYLRGANFEAAITDFSTAVTLDPKRADAWRSRGHAHILSNNLEAAQTDLNRALELAPRAAETYAYRALLFKKMGQPEQGQREIQAAEQIDGENAIVLWARGEIEEAVGNVDAAAASYRAALERNPKLKPAQLGLSRLGKPVATTAEVVAGAGKDGWQIVSNGARYFARNEKFRRLQLPVEPIGGEVPKVVSWTVKNGGASRVGVLTVTTGTVPTREETAIPVQTSAVIDVKRIRLLAMAPLKLGDVAGEVELKGEVVTVSAADGLVDRISLVQRPPVVAATPGPRRTGRRGPSSGRTPDWAPWARGSESYRRRSTPRRYGRRRRRRAKSLFELFLGN